MQRLNPSSMGDPIPANTLASFKSRISLEESRLRLPYVQLSVDGFSRQNDRPWDVVQEAVTW